MLWLVEVVVVEMLMRDMELVEVVPEDT